MLFIIIYNIKRLSIVFHVIWIKKINESYHFVLLKIFLKKKKKKKNTIKKKLDKYFKTLFIIKNI